jgi:hypothetical protein
MKNDDQKVNSVDPAATLFDSNFSQVTGLPIATASSPRLALFCLFLSANADKSDHKQLAYGCLHTEHFLVQTQEKNKLSIKKVV